jgi:hypothetical protein
MINHSDLPDPNEETLDSHMMNPIEEGDGLYSLLCDEQD